MSCEYCEGNSKIIETKGLSASILLINLRPHIEIEYMGLDENSDVEFEINFCPMCGESLSNSKNIKSVIEERIKKLEEDKTRDLNDIIYFSRKHILVREYNKRITELKWVLEQLEGGNNESI